MAATDLTTKDPAVAGLRALVVGLGRSGLAAARLLISRGALVTVADQRSEDDLGGAAADARKLGAEVRAGGHPPEMTSAADLVIVSPGVPSDAGIVQAARRRGIPVWGEVELAFRFCKGRIVGITGSNGKSTTTAMTGAVLRAAGIAGGTGGNLGTPFAEMLADDAPDAVHALELSSFQLETVEAFRPEIAVLLNLSPDHLDRYATYDDYARAKARILEAQDAFGHAVLNADDAESARYVPCVRARLHWFSMRSQPASGAFVREGVLVLRTETGEDEVLPARDLPVPGPHNVANALAAALACRLAGCAPDAIARGLRSFRALPHRLQLVGRIGDVAFYDDSKATNLDAAARALESFPAGSVHVILGGKDKGSDWSSIARLVGRQARRVLLVGKAAPVIREALRDVVPLEDCGTVSAAVVAGLKGAREGDVVLLAPGCASFDQYRNFEERGDDFRRAVESLASGGGRDA